MALQITVQPVGVVRVALMQVLELQHIVEHVSVKLARLAPLVEHSLDLHQPRFDVALRDPFQPLVELGAEFGDGIVAVQLQPFIFGARQIEQSPNPADLVGTKRGVLWTLEERTVGVLSSLSCSTNGMICRTSSNPTSRAPRKKALALTKTITVIRLRTDNPLRVCAPKSLSWSFPVS